jgi:hypothetical protein
LAPVKGISCKDEIIHLVLSNSRVDYFLLVKDRIATIKLANAIANINASNTVTASPPFDRGIADHP